MPWVFHSESLAAYDKLVTGQITLEEFSKLKPKNTFKFMPYRSLPEKPKKPKIGWRCRIGWHKWLELGEAPTYEPKLGLFPDHIEMCARCKLIRRFANPHFE